MTPDELEYRIGISRRTAVGWRELLSTLQPEGTLEMISDEIEILARPIHTDEGLSPMLAG